MEFFDNAINTAKDAFEVARRKTDEVVTDQKQKFNIASIKAKRAKDYEKLGAAIFEKIGDIEIEDEKIKALVEEIKLKNEQIEKISEERKANKEV